MKITAVLCKKCGDMVYSRCTHDFRECSCGSVAVDGGFDYLRIVGHSENYELFSKIIDGDVCKKNEIRLALYNDWNYKADKFGLIKRDKSEKTKKTKKDKINKTNRISRISRKPKKMHT